MKTNLLLILLFLTICVTAQNRSSGTVSTFVGAVPAQQSTISEIFRFQPGLVTQIDQGTGFGFTSDRWFSIGSLNTGSQTVYGLRFQLPNKSLTFGYNNVSNNNPRLEWIGTGANLGNLEFRVANSFSSTVSDLVATMTNTGNTIFGNPQAFSSNAKVVVATSGETGIDVRSTTSQRIGTGINIEQSGGTTSNIGGAITTSGGGETFGLYMKTKGRQRNATGIYSFAFGGAQNVFGVLGAIETEPNFAAGIYGLGRQNTGNQWAGFFDGDVFVSGAFNNPSDAKLKENVKQELSVLDKLALLKPITYTYKNIQEINLAKGLQHGFIAQELATVFPELTKDVTKPILDKEGKSSGNFEFKSVNYSGLISILTAAVNELNTELKAVKEELATIKNTSATSAKDAKVFMEQNIPNPFSDQTTIRYQLPDGTTNADIMVLDLNGKMIKNYPINKNYSEITIKASEIGSGMFIYTLVQNGQVILTKKMIIK